MWLWKILALLTLTFSVSNVAAGPDSSSIEDVFKDVTLDKDNHNLVDDIAHFVVDKIQEATSAVGATGIVDPGKLQEYVTSAMGTATMWLAEKTGSLYEKISDRVSQWWSGSQTRGVWISKEELSQELKKKVLKDLYAKIEQELKLKNITTDKDLERVVLPVIKKTFAALFGIPVETDEFPNKQ